MYTINGRQYSFADVTVIGAGRDILGLKGIEYEESQDKEHAYGKGDMPHSIQRGNKSFSGTLTVKQSEVIGLEQLSPTGSILDLNINLAVSYGEPAKGEMMRTDTLYGVEFTSVPKSTKQGDMEQEIALPFLCLKITKE